MKWVCVDQRVAREVGVPWALAKIGLRFPWVDPVAIMLFDGDILRACAVYTDYDLGNVSMHIASDGTRKWMTREFLRACFHYPFKELKVRRVTGLVAASNPRALRFDTHLGFRLEGRIRQGAQDGSDLLVLGMLRGECRYLKEPVHGQELSALCA